MNTSEKSRSRTGLLLAVVPPVAVALWVAASMSGLALGIVPTLVCLPVAMLAMTFTRNPVAEYQSSSQSLNAKIPAGLLPFTLGYLRFHATRASLPLWPIVALVLGPIVVLGTGWLVLLIGAFL